MLIQKLDETVATIQKYKESNERQTKYQEYLKAYNHLLNVAPTCQFIGDSFAVLHNRDQEFFSNCEVDIILSTIREIQTGFTTGSNPPGIPKINNLSNQLDEMAIFVKDEWKTYLGNETKRLIDALQAVESLVDDPTDIRTVIKKTRDLETVWPIKAINVDSMDALKKQADLIMTGLNVTEEVQAFLNLVIAGQARLSDVTPTIMEWLDKNNLGKNLGIKFTR